MHLARNGEAVGGSEFSQPETLSRQEKELLSKVEGVGRLLLEQTAEGEAYEALWREEMVASMIGIQCYERAGRQLSTLPGC